MMDRPCWSLAVNGLLLKTLQVKICYIFWNLIRRCNNEVNFPCLTPAPKRSPARSVMIWCTVHQLISSRAIVWLDKPSTTLLCFRFSIQLCLVLSVRFWHCECFYQSGITKHNLQDGIKTRSDYSKDWIVTFSIFTNFWHHLQIDSTFLLGGQCHLHRVY